MTVSQSTIHESELQHLLRQAAAESAATTAAYCIGRGRDVLPHHAADRLEEELAWIAARVTERG